MVEPSRARLIIVDDEEDMLRLLDRSVSAEIDCDVDTAINAYKARELMDKNIYDLAMLDIRMPGMDGMTFMREIAREYPETTIIMMTAYGTIDQAVEAIKQGAYDFLAKPFDLDKAIHLVAKALERSRLIRQNRLLQRRIQEQESFQEMVGSSAKMIKVFETIRVVAKTDATVLITGESGTGKDMAARALHRLSPRADKPFVAVNCPNLPEEILESELFGYRKGAFTHAVRDKKGLFWEAQDGTIYLDEIGDISLTLQTKLLRVLQDKEIRPLGETKSVRADVRIIASTNQNLRDKIERKLFREDLFYRLNVISVHMPSLRDRPEDIPLLADHFVQKCSREHSKEPKRLSPKLVERLVRHPWPGNVRELENLVRRAVILSPACEIRTQDMDLGDEDQGECLVTDEVKRLPYKAAKNLVLQRFHQEYISSALGRTQGNITRAARECGLERQALQQVMKRYGMKSKDFNPSDSPG